jgi:hypothetical protein
VKQFFFLLMTVGMAMSLAAQVQLPEHEFVSGNWSVKDGRVYQDDANARLAKVNIKAPQSGSMLYEFNVRYEGGVEDGQGGFGIHIFVDNVNNRSSWGNGNSWLLWFNYDKNPVDKNIPVGLSAQVYRSYSSSRMDLVESIDLNQYASFLTADKRATPISFRIWVDGDTGEVRVYDPTDPYHSKYYYFTIDKSALPLKGDWVVIRTNGLKMSFAPENN